MKLNVWMIVRDHLRTLYNARTGRLSVVDGLFFYGLPLMTAAAAFKLDFSVSVDAYNVSITFFGIFIALLLNIQVAIFAVFQRQRKKPDDARLAEIQKGEIEARRLLLREANSNLSYLTLVSCVALVTFLVSYVFEWKDGFAAAIGVFLYGHFISTLIMIVKRFHALFQSEYAAD